ncbi:MAG: hypothetical protein IPI67_30195 [Myxococcales bacterium]|nr:hypothetical protein [Myxococcales bacterium]
MQGALWTLGALSGSIPKKMFLTHVPAANFNSPTWSATEEKAAPVFTVFATGKFAPSGLLDPTGVPPEEVQALGTGQTIPADFHWPATGEVPTWLFNLYYPDPGRYLHVVAESTEFPGFDIKNPSEWLAAQLNGLTGLACNSGSDLKLTGAPSIGPTAAQTKAEKAVAALRKGKHWGGVCRNELGNWLLGLEANTGGTYKSYFRDRLLRAGGGFPPLGWTMAKTQVPLFPTVAPDQKFNDDDNQLFIWEMVEVAPGSGAQTHAPDCWHAQSGGIYSVHESCAAGDQYFSDNHWFRYTQRVLRPTVCSAGARAPVFVNSYPPVGVCGAAAQVTQTLTLACMLNAGVSDALPVEKPEIATLADLDGFVVWIDSLSRKAKYQLSKLHIESVPVKVVNDFTNLDVGTNGAKGQHGTLLLELRTALETLAGSWNRTSGDLEQLRNSVDTARLSINGAKIDKDSALATLAIQRMQVHANMIAAASGAISLNPAGAVNAGAQLEFGSAILAKTEQLETLSESKEANTVALALNQLQLTSGPLYTDLQNALGDIRSSTATVLSINGQLSQNENKAKYEAALLERCT